MKHRATVPNAYAHDELLGMRDSLPRRVGVAAMYDSANFYLPLKFAARFSTNDLAPSRWSFDVAREPRREPIILIVSRIIVFIPAFMRLCRRPLSPSADAFASFANSEVGPRKTSPSNAGDIGLI
jgi:hypothetical protein